MPKQINVSLAFSADTAQAKRQIQDLQNQLSKILVEPKGGDFGINKELEQALKLTTQLKVQLQEATDVNTGKLDLTKFNQQLVNSKTTIADYRNALISLGPEGSKAFSTLAASIMRADAPMINLGKNIKALGTALANTARWQMSSSMLHGFIGALQGAYGYAQDLNKSLNSIRIVSGQSVEQMAAFADQANRSAQALSTSTLAYTDAALIFYQQGLTGDDVTERVDTVLKLSNVTGDSAEQVSSYMTAI